MNFRTTLILLLTGMLLQACSPTGPVKFYEGQPKPPGDIARVMVPGPITVESIDGRDVKVPSKETGFYELQLPPGKHLIAFKYELYWGSDSDGMLIKSDLAAVDSNFQAGKTYELTYIKPKDEDEAFEFTNEFRATLVNRSTGEKTASYMIENLDAAMLARKMQQARSTSSSATPPVAAAVPATRSQPMPTADQAVNEDPVKRLKFWWLMANEQERQAFSDWMKTATPSFAEEQ